MIFAPSDRPLIATILLLPDLPLMSLAATIEPMRAANRISGRALYKWTLVSPDGSPAAASCGLPVAVAGAFDPTAATDALFVVGAFNIAAHATRRLLADVRRASRAASAVGGVEAGAWVLALAGLLDGRMATTHWEDLEDFARRFPNVDVRPDRYVVDGPVFTTGGATPALDLMLELIRARQGPALALDVASVFIYDDAKAGSDAQPQVSLGRVERHDRRVARAIRIMEERVDDPLTAAQVAERLSVSRRTLETLFRRALGTSPAAYALSLRLQAARRLIVDAQLSLPDVAARTGFSSASALSRAFKLRFGVPPREARGAKRDGGGVARAPDR